MTAMPRAQATAGGRRAHIPVIDYPLLIAVLGLLGFGLVMVASASLHKIPGDPFHYVLRHLLAIALGLGGAALVSQIPLQAWQRTGTLLYFVGVLLLALVLVPGVGREVNGATRWIPLGPLNFQSSELMKLFAVVYIAAYIERRQDEVARSVWGFVKPMALLSIACLLMLMQPDFGTTAVLVMTALGMLFLAGVPLWQFMILILLAGATLVSLVLVSPYRLARVTAFLNPWADVQNTGYQLAQALIAFGRGHWMGVGLGNGIQKQFYLPEAHTDFLMAVVGEEFGLLGSLVVVGAFAFITWRAFAIGALADRLGQRFSAFVAYGSALTVGLQAFINIGVNVGLLPTKGLTLPFMSYGSNSVIVACLIAAVLLRIDYENRQRLADPSTEVAPWERG
jgi:cell division protein FtsW